LAKIIKIVKLEWYVVPDRERNRSEEILVWSKMFHYMRRIVG